jgi:AraC family transcriptional regulator, regulatory protein of adaptative response / methylated-DNA-[protein]-cysteine methyltransferase
MRKIEIMKTSPRQDAGRASYTNDRQRWDAVASRNAAADGSFVYCVETTGVYCRPSCAARRAKRENVRFHVSCAAAELAGFRPCRRCRPNGPGPAEAYADKVAAACRFIETAGEPPGLKALANAAGMSRFHFHRIFTRLTGLTPKAYALAHRAERTRELLPRSRTVTEAIYGAGFNSNGRFYAESARMLGMKPAVFRQGGTNETIRFAIRKSSLSLVLVAASEKGVCAISLGNDPDRLGRELRERFPKARLIGGDKNFSRIVANVVGLIETPTPGRDLPLDVRGTAFQRRVWQALCDIPAGSTASYTEVAARIGAPQSVRAVASACAANKLAVAIPCHRVLRADGRFSGYRWGVERKRALLRREKKKPTGPPVA